MGTSSAYGGPSGGTPLIPSWLDPTPSPTAPPAPAAAPAQDVQSPPGARPPIPAAAPAGRFTAPRANFTKFAASGGRDRANLGRAVSRYVSTSSGGSRRAAQRMGASRGTAASLVSFLTDAATRGAASALATLDLASLAGRPIEVIFTGLLEHFCPPGGTVDEGIARDAFVETIADLSENGVTNLDGLNADQVQTVFEIFATHSIEARICNDIGGKAVTMPADASEARHVQDQLHDFIRRGVSDALAGLDVGRSTPENALAAVDQVYREAFEILQTMGESEAERG